MAVWSSLLPLFTRIQLDVFQFLRARFEAFVKKADDRVRLYVAAGLEDVGAPHGQTVHLLAKALCLENGIVLFVVGSVEICVVKRYKVNK
jgi:hypothetical protein